MITDIAPCPRELRDVVVECSGAPRRVIGPAAKIKVIPANHGSVP